MLDRTNQSNPTETQTATLEREESFGSILEDARHHEMQSFKEPEQKALDAATLALLGAQADDGHWRYDLEADDEILAVGKFNNEMFHLDIKCPEYQKILSEALTLENELFVLSYWIF